MRHASHQPATGLAGRDPERGGTLDEPSLFGAPQMAIYTVDKQAFHRIPQGMPSFDRLPPR
jgi:hypothetical protein